MTRLSLVFCLIFSTFCSCIFAQDNIDFKNNFTETNKGKFFFYWGGNRGNFSKSNIRFQGDDYDFTIFNVVSHDRPKGWHIDYLNPLRMTIPQTVGRGGYFISDKYQISVGVDHMKYVMTQNQTVDYRGYYPNPGSYGELQDNDKIKLTEDFLMFEHTDGLNYINIEIARFDDISNFFGICETDKLQINFTEGLGTGVLFPKTNTTLLGKERYDEFHISGLGASAHAGLNFTFYKYFFIQTHLKLGYINMYNARTTSSKSDKASHDFFFLEKVFALGGILKF
jgi:hypothetical protein